jgi:hypothetical protein
MGSSSNGLDRICAAVDLDAVANAPTESPGAAVRDVNDAFLAAAYGRAFRCMRSIRELGWPWKADDALILARALVSIVARFAIDTCSRAMKPRPRSRFEDYLTSVANSHRPRNG